MFPSPLQGDNLDKDVFGGSGFIPRDSFQEDGTFVTSRKDYLTYRDMAETVKF